MSSKLCACHSAPHLFTASWANHFHPPLVPLLKKLGPPPGDLVQGVAMSTTDLMLTRAFAQTPLFFVSLRAVQ